MPVWGQILLATAAILVALGTIWQKLIRPGIKLATNAEEMVPLIQELTRVFRDNPNAFSVLDDIAREFRADSGSTLRDVVNRLEDSALANERASEVLKVGVEATKQLAQQDRDQMQRLLISMDRLATKIDRQELARLKVADDLAKTRQRADEIVTQDGEPGEAADAAAQTPDEQP